MSAMLNLTIPCETYARLAPITMQPRHEANAWFQSLRYDNGLLIASNRALLAVEQIGGPAGVAHIAVDAALLKQCKMEGPAQSSLAISINPALGWASATTTLGYVYPGNGMVNAAGENKLADWREIVPAAPASRTKGPMFWDAADVALLASSSPSGRIVFEDKTDIDKPIMVRDAYENRWMGFFLARTYAIDGVMHDSASVPQWLKEACK